MGNFMGYSSATELFTAIGTKIKAKYTKPSGGIPKSDLATAVQTSLDQVSTNQTDVLYAINTGVKNALVINDRETDGSSTIHFSAKNGVVTVTGTCGSNTSFFSINFTGISGRFKLNGCPSGGSDNTYLQRIYTADGSLAIGIDRGSGTAEFTLDPNVKYQWAIRIQGNYAIQNRLVFRPMLYQADTDGSTFQTGSLPNHDLTHLEAEDRTALAEAVDSGAKNLLKCFDTYSAGGITQTSSNGVVSATWAAIGSSNAYCRINEDLKLTPGRYICTGLQVSNASHYLHLELDGTTVDDAVTTDGFEFTVPNTSGTYRLFLGVKANTAAQSSPITVKPMICAKAAFNISQKFVPYAKTNYDLTKYTDGCSLDTSGIKTNVSYDNINKNTFAAYDNTCVNKPTGNGYYCKTDKFSDTAEMQTLTSTSDGRMFTRVKRNGTWTGWNSVGIGHRVYCELTTSSYTHTYPIVWTDFNNYEPSGGAGVMNAGMYMIYIVTWSQTPAISIYAVAYSGASRSYATVQKIAGADADVTIVDKDTSSPKIQIVSTGKVEIVSLT